MVNDSLKKYFEDNILSYSLESLKEAALNQGYSQKDIDEVAKLYPETAARTEHKFVSLSVLILSFFALIGLFYMLFPPFVLLACTLFVSFIISINYYFRSRKEVSFVKHFLLMYLTSVYSSVFFLLFLGFVLYIIHLSYKELVLYFYMTYFPVIIYPVFIVMLVILVFFVYKGLLYLFFPNGYNQNYFFPNQVVTFFWLVFILIISAVTVYLYMSYMFDVNNSLNENVIDSQLRVAEYEDEYGYHNGDYTVSSFTYKLFEVREMYVKERVSFLQQRKDSVYDFVPEMIYSLDYPLRNQDVIDTAGEFSLFIETEDIFFYLMEAYKNETIDDSFDEEIILMIPKFEDSFTCMNSSLKARAVNKSVSGVYDVYPLNSPASGFSYLVNSVLSERLSENMRTSVRSLDNETQVLFRTPYGDDESKNHRQLFYYSYLLAVYTDFNFGRGECEVEESILEDSDTKSLICENRNIFGETDHICGIQR